MRCRQCWVAEQTVGISTGRLALYSVALVAAGIVGDLAESLLKRDAGVKDSSAWMPGFGGVLDLLDSLMGAAPVAYLFWRWGGSGCDGCDSGEYGADHAVHGARRR